MHTNVQHEMLSSVVELPKLRNGEGNIAKGDEALQIAMRIASAMQQ